MPRIVFLGKVSCPELKHPEHNFNKEATGSDRGNTIVIDRVTKRVPEEAERGFLTTQHCGSGRLLLQPSAYFSSSAHVASIFSGAVLP